MQRRLRTRVVRVATACCTALASAKAQREVQADPAHTDPALDAKERHAHTCACGRVFYGKTVSKAAQAGGLETCPLPC